MQFIDLKKQQERVQSGIDKRIHRKKSSDFIPRIAAWARPTCKRCRNPKGYLLNFKTAIRVIQN